MGGDVGDARGEGELGVEALEARDEPWHLAHVAEEEVRRLEASHVGVLLAGLVQAEPLPLLLLGLRYPCGAIARSARSDGMRSSSSSVGAAAPSDAEAPGAQAAAAA